MIYELALVAKPSLSEEELQSCSDLVKRTIKDDGGTTVDYLDEEVEQIKLKDDQYEILTKNKNSLVFDKVFLCAGALNSAKIIIKSFGYPKNDIYLYDIPIRHLPIISLIPQIKIDQNTFGLSSGSGSIILNKNNKKYTDVFWIGIGGGSIILLCPSSGPHTPQLLQALKEQSGTTFSAKAFFSSLASQLLSIPVSI